MVITTFAVRKDTSKWMFVFTPDGKIRPLAINYDKTRTYGIDRVLAVKHGTSRFWRERTLLHLPDLRAEAESLA